MVLVVWCIVMFFVFIVLLIGIVVGVVGGWFVVFDYLFL